MDLARATGLPDPVEVGARYVRVYQEVFAVKADFDGSASTSIGFIRWKAGDYICCDEDGDTLIIPREKFEACFAPVKHNRTIMRRAQLYGT